MDEVEKAFIKWLATRYDNDYRCRGKRDLYVFKYEAVLEAFKAGVAYERTQGEDLDSRS